MTEILFMETGEMKVNGEAVPGLRWMMMDNDRMRLTLQFFGPVNVRLPRNLAEQIIGGWVAHIEVDEEREMMLADLGL